MADSPKVPAASEDVSPPPSLGPLVGALLSLCALALAIAPSLGGFTSHIFPVVPLWLTYWLSHAQTVFTLSALAAVVGALILRRRGSRWRLVTPVVVGLVVVGIASAERRWAPARLFPPVEQPSHVAAEASSWPDGTPVLGLVVGTEVRAYPLTLLAWHQVANDRLGGRALAVTYCPLRDCARAFEAETGGLRFAGLAQYNALLEAQPGDAWFAQRNGERVAGPAAVRLEPVEGVRTSWGAWRAAHPTTTVLTQEESYRFGDGRTPYDGRYAPAPGVKPRPGRGCPDAKMQ